MATLAFVPLLNAACARSMNSVRHGPSQARPLARVDVTAPSTGPMRVEHEGDPQRGLLAELLVWRNRASVDSGSKAGDWRVAALELMRLEAEAGNYHEAHRQSDRFNGAGASGPEQASVAPFEALTPVDALDAITSVAETTQVIMINEAHHVPQHRAFTIALLHALRRRGYNYFAAETLYETDTLLNARGYATQQSGAYIPEPLYGELVRTALKLGYHVVAYEARNFAKGSGGRERRQAENLIRRTLRLDPGAKILVHAGYRHVNKAGTLAGTEPMALQFKELTGVDPFTVDQTEMTEHSAPEYEHPLYRHAIVRGVVAHPTVFRTADRQLWTLEPGVRNVTVFHPRSQYEHGRPTWLRLRGERTPYLLQTGICGAERHCLVDARFVGEQDDAVSVDQIEAARGAALPALMLPNGEFWITARNENGDVVTRVQARVLVPQSPRP